MASKGQMTGMLGAYLAAAELTNKGLIVSLTSRNARGADLLVTDQAYAKTWSIQVKTNRKAASYWLLNADYEAISSPTHVYIFVNLHGAERPDYYIVPSKAVVKYGRVFRSAKGSVWYSFYRQDAERHKYVENWSQFGVSN